MASVDDRVVRLEFDNSQFEKKVAGTLASLDQLNKALKFDGAQKGLSDVQAATSKFSLSGIAEGIEGISKKFLALSAVALTVISNITSKALDAGLRLAKSLSLDQVISGFKEYETNIGSIQTILANTKAQGTNLQQVNAALDELNTYSDKTIYNFGQMTKNIGTFTAAGVDLKTSVSSIKGIANLAAISGSSADQASTAMYQLSQAIATGSLKLMDWNSVVNAGMGGKVFQEALFESGKAMKTIKDVPMGQTFKQWTDAGNSFRDSLKDGWITADVLTTTLGGFTGEMDTAQLKAKGFTDEQIKNMQELGKTGVEAATKIRTFTQLVDTVKESIGSGWSESFRNIFGNFEEATRLFTGFNDAISKVVQKNADARNKLLKGWHDMGGGMILVDGITKGFKALAEIMKPIKQAFQEVFPPMTAKRLVELTDAFAKLMDRMRPSPKTIDEIKRIFKGLFSVLDIGWTIVKEGVKFIGELFGTLTGAGGGKWLEFGAKIGDFFTSLHAMLVDGGGIVDFFNKLRDAVAGIIPIFQQIIDRIAKFFGGLKVNTDVSDKVSAGVGRLSDRLASLKKLFDKLGDIWKPIWNALQKVGEVILKVWDVVKTFMVNLGHKVAQAMGKGDFGEVLDVINIGLLSGIALMIRKFFKSGLKIDLGGGFIDKIKEAFDTLTGTLKAMQTDIKANALLKIAGAIAILTASVLVLSLIDSEALTKALAAMAVGFAQLMASFAIITKISTGPKAALSFTLLAAGMSALAGSLLILSLAAKSLADLDWGQLARGLTGVAALFAIIIVAVIPLSKISGSLISTGLGMIAIATAINILAGAVKIFSTMSWGEMASGMAGLAIGLGIVVAAVRLLPKNMALQGLGLLAVAVALNILALAVKQFAGMNWTEMGKGFLAIGVGLLIIAGAMKLMPISMPIIGAGLILVGLGLIAVAKAMSMIGGMKWGEIGKGLAGIAAALVILAVATNAMTGAIGGAVAIGIASASLLILAKVVKEFAGIKWQDLLRGLIGIAAALAVLGVSAALLEPVIPAMLALGAALVLIGAGFALFGLGALLVGKGFELIGKWAAKGSASFVKALENMGKAIPAFATGLAKGTLDFWKIIAAAAPEIADGLAKLLGAIIDQLIKLLPKALTLIGNLITGVLGLIREKYPQFVETGIGLLLALLNGIRNHIGEVVVIVGEIITGFLDALKLELPKIVQSAADLFTATITAIAEAIGKTSSTLMVGVAISLIDGFLKGLNDQLKKVWSWFTGLVTGIINLVKRLFGIKSPSTVFLNIGLDLIKGFLNGIIQGAVAVTNWFKGLAGKITSAIGGLGLTLWNKGWDLVNGVLLGMQAAFTGAKRWVTDALKGIGSFIAKPLNILKDVGKKIIQGLWDGMKEVWNKVTGWVGGLGGWISAHKGPPKKDAVLLYNNGMLIMQGLQKGMEEGWATTTSWLTDLDPAAIMSKNLSDISTAISGAFDEVTPTITPVLDLTQVQADAKKIGDYIATPQVTPSVSYAQAQTIAATTTPTTDITGATAQPAQVNFNQVINAPEQLSTADIYKQTRNQITMAKEELAIP